MVQVLEEFRWLRPPANYRTTVERLLKSVPPEYLKDLDRVCLRDTAALRGAWPAKMPPDTGNAGAYVHAWKGHKAEIELNLDVITAGCPNWAQKIPILREGLVGRVLFHEIGHHIHHTVKRDPRPKEVMADRWARLLWRSYILRRLWYLRPDRPPVRWLLMGVGRLVKPRPDEKPAKPSLAKVLQERRRPPGSPSARAGLSHRRRRRK
jgi:hypothetical protein